MWILIFPENSALESQLSGSPEVKVEPADEVLATENDQNSTTQNRIFENPDIKDEFSEDEIEEVVLEDTPIYRSVN